MFLINGGTGSPQPFLLKPENFNSFKFLKLKHIQKAHNYIEAFPSLSVFSNVYMKAKQVFTVRVRLSYKQYFILAVMGKLIFLPLGDFSY